MHGIQPWLSEELAKSQLQVNRIPFRESGEWEWDEKGFWSHVTRRFFSVVGVRYFSVAHGMFRTQPIINQSEIGLLCFLVFKDNGDWWILGHAKVEPGNVNGAQLAPTIQATQSNYEMAHGGADTPYLSHAQVADRSLCRLLQSEQNCRFLAKRNCNSVVRLPERVQELDSRFKWMHVTDLLSVLGESHTVNTDARSVLVCWLLTDAAALRQCLPASPFPGAALISSLESRASMNSDESLESWLNVLNRQWKAHASTLPIARLEAPWQCRETEIVSPGDPSLMIYQIAVRCAGREVNHWDQPISGSRSRAMVVLLIGDFEGTLHVLLQAVLEAGNRSGFELTTTVQAEASETASPHELPYLEMAETSGRTILQFENSEEGGRFDRCISEYRIVWVDEVSAASEGLFHRWVSVSQISQFLRRQDRITNELRSALSSLLGGGHV